jgi:peptidylamidoglycolate lyase
MRPRSSVLLKIALYFFAGATLLLAADSYEVVHGWPIVPDQFAFGQVSGVGVDSQNRVWVFHRGQFPMMVFDGASGRLLMAFGDLMAKQSEGLSIDGQDNVWMTDIGRHQVFKFAKDGNLLMTLGVQEKAGQDTAHFDGPTAVAAARGGEFYVADGYGNSRIVKFDKDGKFLLEWGKKGSGPGEFDTPHGIAIDNQDRVYVADRGNARIQIFDPQGKFLQEWKSEEIGRPWALTFARDGYLYVVDGGDLKPNPPDRARVLKMDLQGHVIDRLGTYGKSDGQLYWPHGVGVAPNGDVYVSDVNVGMRVQKFVKK